MHKELKGMDPYLHGDYTPPANDNSRNHWLIDHTPLMSVLAVLMVGFMVLMRNLNEVVLMIAGQP